MLNCIPRTEMPQVDEKAYPLLKNYLEGLHVHISRIDIPPSWLTLRQCMEGVEACRRIKLLGKPLLVSADLGILDGYHRYLRHLQEGTKYIPCLQIYLHFDEALTALRTFNATNGEGVE